MTTTKSAVYSFGATRWRKLASNSSERARRCLRNSPFDLLLTHCDLLRLGDDYANPLDPAAIRANAAGAAQARANGGSAPQTPSQKKKRPTRNVASDSDGEDTPAYPGWYASDSDGEQRRGPSSSASKRQHLATPDPSPSVKKIKRLDKSNIGYLGPPPELNTFGVAPSASTSTAAVEALNAEDPFPTLLETVEMAQLHSRKIKAQLKSVTVRNGWLEGELTSVRARLGEAEERVGKVEGALQAKMEESELRSAIIE